MKQKEMLPIIVYLTVEEAETQETLSHLPTVTQPVSDKLWIRTQILLILKATSLLHPFLSINIQVDDSVAESGEHIWEDLD